MNLIIFCVCVVPIIGSLVGLYFNFKKPTELFENFKLSPNASLLVSRITGIIGGAMIGFIVGLTIYYVTQFYGNL